jgi:hypothetical protein
MLPPIHTKDGSAVDMNVHPAFKEAEPIIMSLWSQFGLHAVVTAGRDNGHSTKSAHHDGRALDLRHWYIQDPKVFGNGLARALNMLLPNWKWYVVLEPDHFHLEVTEPADAPNITSWKPGKYFYVKESK